jgi:8-amino-7-oxononanoate synthase
VSLQRLRTKLAELKSEDRLRSLREVASPQGRLLHFNGRDYLNFSSNDYLGLAASPELRSAFVRGIERWGAGAGASRLVNGSLQAFHDLERALAEFKGSEAALLFNSGYHANLGVLSCLVGEGDVVFSDELNHASMIDGLRLAKAERIRYRHNDLNDLRERMAQARESGKKGQYLIATETLFSMDGDRAALNGLIELSAEFDAWLYLDEAHATGVYGPTGAGCFEEFRGDPRVKDRVIQMGTLGKALGCFGAYVAGPRVLIDYLINQARPFIYTTALPPALAEAALEALGLLRSKPELRDRLWQRIGQTRAAGKGLDSPILPLVVGTSEKALELSQALFDKGYWVNAIRPPTVPEGSARLRITLSAFHEPDDLRRLLQALEGF